MADYCSANFPRGRLWASISSLVAGIGLMSIATVADAALLGKAVSYADDRGGLVIEIPLVATAEELSAMSAGVHVDAACSGCAGATYRADIQRAADSSQSFVRISGPVPKDRTYLELQAWIEWAADGHLAGDMRRYKVNIYGQVSLPVRRRE